MTDSTTSEIPQASTSRDAAVTDDKRRIIQVGDVLMLRLPNKAVRTITLRDKGHVNLGKCGTFNASELVGKLYGMTFEIGKEGKLSEKVDLPITEIEETDATNENILSSSGAQGLTSEDIAALKSGGASGRDIIAKQIEEHTAFQLKNEYSKSKYIARKESKYIKYFTVFPPTEYYVCEADFISKTPSGSKIRDLRPDSLAQILTSANARPGTRAIVVEECSGLLVGSLLGRMAGQGQCLVLHDADSPPALPLLPAFNLTEEEMKPYFYLDWMTADPDYEHASLPLEPENGEFSSSKERIRYSKRKEALKKLIQKRDDLLNGGWDSLIISCPHEPQSIIEHLEPYLGGSANIVVHAPSAQSLMPALQYMRNSSSYIAVTLSEPTLRRYQVLPGRTHPEMNGTAHGGFILTAIRVITAEGASYQAATLQGRSKRSRTE